MSKKISLGSEAMSKMLVGLNKCAVPVISTIGPCGKNSFIGGDIPRITNDGFTVASNIFLEDPEEDSGAYVIRNVCGQQNDDVGDGTTTVAVLTKSIIEESLKRPEDTNHIKDSLKESGNKILKTLAKKSIKIDIKDIEQVALISAEDTNLAHTITQIIHKLGDKAVINVEDSRTFATEYEVLEGFETTLGFMSPAFITDKKSARAIHSDIAVLCSEKKISNISDISKIFEMFKRENIGSCVIVCDDIDDSILGLLATNNQMGTFKSIVIRATNMFLEDIAGYTGAKIISPSTGITFQNFDKKYLGYAKKVVCDAHKTLFIGDGESHKQYVKELEVKTEGEPNMFTQRNMKKRLDRLQGNIAVLKIGASTDFERDYLKYKAEDAVKAVQSALAEGIVEGGGMTLWRIAQEIKPKTVGDIILKKALVSPLKQICENAGLDYAEIAMNLPEGMGYDFKSNRYVNMIEEGIIDPTKVERCAIENAVSAAATFITTGNLITDIKETK